MIHFCGLSLKNPVVVASCPATETANNVSKCVEAGAGAVILKSVGPDKIIANNDYPRRMVFKDGTLYMLSSSKREILAAEKGVQLIKECRKTVSIPIIASVCGSLDNSLEWESICKSMIDAGADMVQLDSIYCIGLGKVIDDLQFANLVEISENIQSNLKKPVMLKISPNVHIQTAIKHLNGKNLAINLLDSIPVGVPVSFESPGFSSFRGVQKYGECLAAGKILYPLSLLYTQRLAKARIGPICAGGGIFNGVDAAGLLLSGASIIQIATAVCVHGFSAIQKIVNEIREISFQYGLDFESDAGRLLIEGIGEIDTQIIDGKVFHGIAECGACADPTCEKTLMCGDKEKGCEGCGICIDVCPKKIAFFK